MKKTTMSIELTVKEHPVNLGNYRYTIKDDETIVVAGVIEEFNKDLHPMLLLEKVIEDAKTSLHMIRNGR
jgi:hypothetical protein